MARDAGNARHAEVRLVRRDALAGTVQLAWPHLDAGRLCVWEPVPGRRRRARPHGDDQPGRSATCCSAASPAPANRSPSRCSSPPPRWTPTWICGCWTANASSSRCGATAPARSSARRGRGDRRAPPTPNRDGATVRAAPRPAPPQGRAGRRPQAASGRLRRAGVLHLRRRTQSPRGAQHPVRRPDTPGQGRGGRLDRRRPETLRRRGPTSLRDLVGYRWALRCSTRGASDTILGAVTAAAGYTASDVAGTSAASGC